MSLVVDAIEAIVVYATIAGMTIGAAVYLLAVGIDTYRWLKGAG